MIKNIISVVAAHSILLSILQKGTFIYFLTLRKNLIYFLVPLAPFEDPLRFCLLLFFY